MTLTLTNTATLIYKYIYRRIKERGGICIIINGIETHAESHPLGLTPSVFQCELFAIERAARWIINEELPSSIITIHTDSLAGLNALDTNYITSRQIKSTMISLNKIGEQHKVTIQWIPGHSGLKGSLTREQTNWLGKDRYRP